MSCRALRGLPARVPVALEWGSGGVETTVQKYKLFPTWQKKNAGLLKRACMYAGKMAVGYCRWKGYFFRRPRRAVTL